MIPGSFAARGKTFVESKDIPIPRGIKVAEAVEQFARFFQFSDDSIAGVERDELEEYASILAVQCGEVWRTACHDRSARERDDER